MQVHLLVEVIHVFPVSPSAAGGAQHAFEKGGGSHSVQVHPEFGELSVAENKQKEEFKITLHCESQLQSLRDIIKQRKIT